MAWVSRPSSALDGAFTQRKCSEPSGCSTYTPVEEQHMKMDVKVERAAESLDQGDRTGLGPLAGISRLLDQVRGDAAVDDAEHLTQ